jgi:S-disulfanyl-L-cysteine oxidoreductase SoxD
MVRHWALGLAFLIGLFPVPIHGQQARTSNDGVYTDEQASRGQGIYMERCATCHGAALQGGAAPALAGADLARAWSAQPLSDLVGKIQNTMPANEPGKLTRQQTVEIVAYLLQAGKFPAGPSELAADDGALKLITFPAAAAGAKPASTSAAQAFAAQPLGNLAQIMRGILFPSSNLIFSAQGQDPGAPKEAYKPGTTGFNWADWGAGIYAGWELVDYAAVALADVAPLLLVPRRCENGRPAPVERADWVKYTQELADAGRAVFKASQTRNQEAVSDATNVLADSCLNCHVAYRDKPGGAAGDPSNKAARCVP